MATLHYGRILLVIALFFSIPVLLSAQPEHIVSKGESLYQIARKYDLSVEELRRMNSLTGRFIKPGQVLKVSSVETEETKTSEVGSVYRTEKKYHRIRKGDTLSSIARRYEATVEGIKRLNEISGNRITAGERLLVKVSRVRVPSVREPVIEIANNEPVQERPQLPDGIFADGVAAKVLEGAFCFLDVPYRLGGFSHIGIDCSGLVKKAFGSIGVELPRTARSQFLEGISIPLAELSPGDLLFFASRAARRYPSHVGIYLGNGLILHASRSARRVIVDNFESSSYLKRHFIGARRILDETESEDSGRTGE